MDRPIQAAMVAALLLSGLVWSSWASSAPAHGEEKLSETQTRVGVMTFNVENLFDTVHDVGKEDYAFLPLKAKQTEEHRMFCRTIEKDSWREQCLTLDWSEEALEGKMQELAKTILQVNDGKGPDVLVLQEVENLEVLETLRKKHLAPADYRPGILIEGKDVRGIDIAILSRLPLVKGPDLIEIPFRDMPQSELSDTRGILKCTFRLPNGEELVVFGVHFPAPHHETRYRVEAFRFLNQLAQEIDSKANVVAAGDFNVPIEEDAQHQVLEKHVSSVWALPHQVSSIEAKGTTYYPPKQSWSFLDMILFLNHAPRKSRWNLDSKSVKVVNDYPNQKRENGTPKSYDPETKIGVSDHWPVYLELFQQN